MTDGKIYENDVAVKFIVKTGIDLTNATLLQLKVIRGDLSAATWTGILCPDDNTAIQYTSATPDLNVSGKYKMYAYAEFNSGASKHSGTVVVFTVYDVFK